MALSSLHCDNGVTVPTLCSAGRQEHWELTHSHSHSLSATPPSLFTWPGRIWIDTPPHLQPPFALLSSATFNIQAPLRLPANHYLSLLLFLPVSLPLWGPQKTLLTVFSQAPTPSQFTFYLGQLPEWNKWVMPFLDHKKWHATKIKEFGGHGRSAFIKPCDYMETMYQARFCTTIYKL